MRIPDIVLIGPITDVSGVAEVNRNLFIALDKIGVKVKLVEPGGWSIHKADVSPELRDKINEGFSRGDLQNPCVIHSYQPHSVPGMPIIEKAKVNVTYTVFETDKVPFQWKNTLNSEHVAENWVPFNFIANAYGNSGVDKNKIKVMPYGVDVNRFTPEGPQLDLGERKGFRFITSFDWSPRKNPNAIFNAFLQEFANDEDVELVVKSYMGNAGDDTKNRIRQDIKNLKILNRSNKGIKLITDFIHEDSVASFHRSGDCWINLSRGEGFDLGSIQSMACGVPVVASANTAHNEYMTNVDSYLVRCTKTPIVSNEVLAHAPLFIGHSWYEPDVQQARVKMREAYNDWKSGKFEAKKAAARAKACSMPWEATAAKIVFELGKYC